MLLNCFAAYEQNEGRPQQKAQLQDIASNIR